jgi:hypothetical protein
MVWQVKNPSLLEAIIAKYRSQCAALSAVMVTAAR